MVSSATGRPSLGDSYILRNTANGLSAMLRDRTTMVYFLVLVAILLLGILGPVLAPYPYDMSHYDDQGLERLEGPSLKHPLGTTDLGMDILSRVLYGARPTVITGLLGGTIIISIGMVIGITAGYMGGYVESVLMRFTDIVYGVPLIPFALVVIGFLGIGFIESIVTIGLILWRANARVLRSQVLQVKKRPYVQVARANGASHTRIVIKHILPNVAPMAVLFFSIGVGYSIIIQAGLAFLGVSNPFIPSWGIMVRNAYNSGAMADAWYWAVIPGLLISLTVLSTFMFGRGYESIIKDDSTGTIAEAG